MCSICTSILSYFIFRLLGNPLPLYRKKPQTYMYQLSRSWQVVKYCQLKLPCFLMFTKMMYSDNENHRVKKHLNIFLTITIPNYLKHITASNWNIANTFIPFIIHLTVLCPDSIYTCPGLKHIICNKNSKAVLGQAFDRFIPLVSSRKAAAFSLIWEITSEKITFSSLKQGKGEYHNKELQQNKTNVKYSFKLILQKKYGSY